MSVEQIGQVLLKLDRKERRRFADWFHENEEQLTGPDYVHPRVKAEILRRLEEADAYPELLEPWEGTTERVRERLHGLRRQEKKVMRNQTTEDKRQLRMNLERAVQTTDGRRWTQMKRHCERRRGHPLGEGFFREESVSICVHLRFPFFSLHPNCGI